MKKPILKIDMVYDVNGNCHAVRITRGSFYLTHATRTYKFNEMSDAQHNLSIALSNRDKWTSFFYKTLITAYPAHFMLMEGDKCRAAGSLDHCKRFFKAGMKITRRLDYPKLPPIR